MPLDSSDSTCAICRRRRDCIAGDRGGIVSVNDSPVALVEVVEAGRGLAEPGGQGRLIGILRSGLLRLDRVDARGKRHMLGLVLPGEPVGELLPTASAQAVTAVVTSRICRFRTDRERDFSDFPQQLRHHLLSSFSVRLARLHSFLWIRASLSVNARVAALLLIAARIAEPSPLPHGGALLSFVLPRRDAADLLSTTVESFCRGLYGLESDGYITIHDSRHFELRDIAGLERLSALDGSYLDTLFPRISAQTRPRIRAIADAPMHSASGRLGGRVTQRSADITIR